MRIKATVNRIKYRGDSGWTVIDFVDETNMRFTGTGMMPSAFEGEKLELTGEWTVHKTYGRQFGVQSYESVAPDSTEALFRYLSSGLVKGVGLPTANAIIKKFGEDSLDIIEHDYKKLELIPGIGKVKSQMIHDSFMEKRAVQDIYMAMQQLGFSINQTSRIHKLYGDGCVQMIKDNPYRLIEDVDSIGFKTADKIAQNAGFDHDSPFRIKAGIRHALNEARNDGNTCLPRELLIKRASEDILGVDLLPVETALDEMTVNGELVEKHINGEDLVFLSYLHYQELHSAVCLYDLYTNAKVLPMFDIDGEIERLEKKHCLELDEKQRNAVKGAVEEGVIVITGGPGTGKTTILSFIIEIMENMELSLELAAPTGRAAKRISDTTGREARTIHRLLEYGGYENDGFAKDETDPIEADAVIIDEMSMVDIGLFHSLLKAIPQGTRLIMVGDFDQLPPVGAGNVLRDIILSETVPVVRLTDIYRQAGRSMIVVNAHRINNGMIPVVDSRESDFIFISRPGMEEALDTVISMCRQFSETGSEGEFQVLAPMKSNILGVANLNLRIQEAINPPSPDKAEKQYGETVFRVGDRVMQTRNNYKMEWKRSRFGVPQEDGAGVFNGDIGTVMGITGGGMKISILFDDERLAEYSGADLDDIELAYAVSIHKSQGSEFSTVILPLVYGPPMLMNRNILYTAVTRARNRVYIVGTAKCVEAMVRNTMSAKRYSALEAFLRQMKDSESETELL
ncbi:MAG: ATP-dependent RecD-like DNA helicase [Clostridiales bacterium]|nr:ATP-dependent RecD-like DNA helicase [Clostridiales bacterium]